MNMLRTQRFAIEKIYVPVKRRKTLNSKIVREIAESMLEVGQQTPILVREDGDRFVLVEGLHRLEACKELGEATVLAVIDLAEPARERYRGEAATLRLTTGVSHGLQWSIFHRVPPVYGAAGLPAGRRFNSLSGTYGTTPCRLTPPEASPCCYADSSITLFTPSTAS